MQCCCKVRNGTAIDSEAGGGRAGHSLEGFEAGFLHRMIRFFVIRVAGQMCIHGQKPRVFARTFVMDLARRGTGADKSISRSGIAGFSGTAAKIAVGEIKRFEPVPDQADMQVGGLVGGTGKGEVPGGEAVSVRSTRLNERQRLNHLGGGTRQNYLVGVAPGMKDVTIFVAHHSMAVVNAFKERSAPDFGKGGSLGHVSSFSWANSCQSGFRRSPVCRYYACCREKYSSFEKSVTRMAA